MDKRITIKDIAKNAGVSVMTVSLALRDDPSISQATIAIIKKLAVELGYIPNHVAKSLVHGRTKMIAVLVGGSLHDDYHNEFLNGASSYAMSNGYTLTIGLSEGDSSVEAMLISKFREIMVDGFLAFHCLESSNYKCLKNNGIPFVLYTKYFDDLDSDYVICDDIKGGYLVTKYLLNLGHKRVAFVYHDYIANSTEVQNRLTGYKKAHESAGISIDENLIIPFSYYFNTMQTSSLNYDLIRTLQSSDPPTALFICNDITASYVYIVLKRAGMKIPEDISIVGYEGIYLGTLLDPPLTTVSSPIRDMGSTACKLLIDRIEGRVQRQDTNKIKLNPILTIRNSTLRLTKKETN